MPERKSDYPTLSYTEVDFFEFPGWGPMGVAERGRVTGCVKWLLGDREFVSEGEAKYEAPAREMLERQRARAYVKAGGTRCLYCGHDQLTGGPVVVNEGVAVQAVGCDGCDRDWTDVYEMRAVRVTFPAEQEVRLADE